MKSTGKTMQALQLNPRLGMALVCVCRSMASGLDEGAREEHREALIRMRKLAEDTYCGQFLNKLSQAEFCMFIGTLLEFMGNMLEPDPEDIETDGSVN